MTTNDILLSEQLLMEFEIATPLRSNMFRLFYFLYKEYFIIYSYANALLYLVELTL